MLDNPLQTGDIPRLGKGNDEIVVSILYGDPDKVLEMEEILEKKGGHKINNMYAPDGSQQKWICPACQKEGVRINHYMGRCRTQGCIGVAPEQTVKDCRRRVKRKVEAVVIDKRDNKVRGQAYILDRWIREKDKRNKRTKKHRMGNSPIQPAQTGK